MKELDFYLAPESNSEIPVKSDVDPDPEFPSKSYPDPEIIFSDQIKCVEILEIVRLILS